MTWLIWNNAGADKPLRFRAWPQGARVSGSGALAWRDFTDLAARVPPGHTGCIVDLRQESHAILNGEPVSWWGEDNAANAGKSLEAIGRDEDGRIRTLQACVDTPIAIHRLHKQDNAPAQRVLEKVFVRTVSSEAAAAAAHGFDYLRLPMQDHTSAPEPETVDVFMARVRSRPPDSAWHLHCQAGKGRTSMFTLLFDMLTRTKPWTLEELVASHHAHGAVDLLQTSDREPRRSKYAGRIAFLRTFHRYVEEGSAANGVAWSTWLRAMHGRS